MGPLDANAVSVWRKVRILCVLCCSVCTNSNNAARRSLTSALVMKCYWFLCVSGISRGDVSALTEWPRDHFHWLKLCVLLSSSHKVIACVQKTWNTTRLVCNAFILLFWVSFSNKYLWLYLYLSVYVGRFRVGLGAPMYPFRLNYFCFLQMYTNH